ncbi:TNF receptor-associated factor 2-like [Diadema antillarum]|uniref:TNF receptor-associated factor 2-like n=1 Tax=Diadema antillarum TaxID=105358 RepID=UPI003A85A7C8
MPCCHGLLSRSITFQLVNQADPHNKSIVEAFWPDQTSSSFKRPTSDRNIGAGCPRFAKIRLVEDPNQGFLRDNTHYLKIISQTSDNHERVCGNEERIQCKVFGCGKWLPKNRALKVHKADAWCPMILLMKTCFTEEEISHFSSEETWDVTIKRVMETDKKNVKHLIERLIHIFCHFDSSSLPPDYEKADREEHVDHQVLLSDFLDRELQVLRLLQIELCQMVQESKRRIQDLECSYSGVFLWKIDNYSQRKREAATTNKKSIYSPPFFTSQYGYKLCGRVFLMGDGVGKGTHISLFLTIMRGPYDAVLSWPFKEKITFQLVNQVDPINRSIIVSLRPDPTSSSFKRPTSERNIGAGCPLFVKILQVEDSNQGFLKDGTLYLKIISQTSDVPQTNRARGDILPVSS